LASLSTTLVQGADTRRLLCFWIDLMKQYRKLDDTIVTKLNRANAARRDSNRTRGVASYVQVR
jgi:hypothetical protein